VSRTAIDSLEKIGPPALPKMYQLVGTTSGPTRERLMDTLEKIGSPPLDQLPALANLAKDPNELVRHNAIKLLCKLDPAESAVPALKELLQDKKLVSAKGNVDFDVLVRAMVPLGKKAEPLLPELQAVMIANHYWNAEEQLMETIKKCGPAGAKALVKVLTTLHDPKAPPDADGAMRPAIVVRRLGEMGADAKLEVPTLVELLKERTALQPQILDALGDIGPAARADAAPAVEMLLAKERQNDPVLAEKARTALNRMGVFQKKAETPKAEKLP
jgi:HEAT repeat protein